MSGLAKSKFKKGYTKREFRRVSKQGIQIYGEKYFDEKLLPYVGTFVMLDYGQNGVEVWTEDGVKICTLITSKY